MESFSNGFLKLLGSWKLKMFDGCSMMPRPQKLRNPRAIIAQVEAEIREEMDKVRGKLSWGEFFTLMWKREKDYITLSVENENLRRENLELKRRVEELERLVERLQTALEKSKPLTKEDRELVELKSQVERIFDSRTSMKMLDFMRLIGFTNSGESLLLQARMFIEKYFRKDGRFYVSEDLGLMIIPDERFGELAWVIRRMSHSGSFPKSVEVEVDE